MDKFYKNRLFELETTINDLEIEADCPIQRIEAIIVLVINALSKLKEDVLERGFKNMDEEIYFFKHIKPQFVSKLIYYNSIYKIETKKPYGEKSIKKYIREELAKLKQYFDNNLEFYRYYRTNNTFLDEKIFVRGKYDIKLNLYTYFFETDHSFSTSHDYKVAKIIANDQIQIYLEDQLYNSRKNLSYTPGLKWTGSKTALIELIYGLYAQGVFDNGNADIKIIARVFERAFNVDLGDFYHTYLELKSRKINRTKFLDSLREALIKKMDEQEERE